MFTKNVRAARADDLVREREDAVAAFQLAMESIAERSEARAAVLEQQLADMQAELFKLATLQTEIATE